MSFNKQPPPADLPRYGGSHNSIRDVFGGNKRSSGGEGGARGGGFFRYFDFPVNQVVSVIFHPKPFRNEVVGPDGLVVVHEAPFKRFMQHWHNTKRKFTICSGGPDYWDDKRASAACSGCAEFFGNRKKVGGKWENTGPVGRTENFAFSIAVLGTFYMVPTDRVNPRTNLPYDEPALYGDPRLPKSKAELAKLKTVDGMRFIYKTSRSGFGVLFGADTLPAGSGIDEQLRKNCMACDGQGSFDEESGICGNCGADDSNRMTLHSPRVLQLRNVVTGSPRQAGQRPPTAIILVGTQPIPDGINPELLEAIPLDACVAPTPAEKQMEVYGYAPKVTPQGVTGVEDVAPEDDDQDPLPF